MGEVEVAQLLLAAGADVNKNISGYTILQAIASAGTVAQHKSGVVAGSLVNPASQATANSSNKLMAGKAARAPDNLVMAQALLAAGANVSAVDPKGRTALHMAASHGRCEWVQVLLKAGADPQRRDDAGQTALHAAAGGGHDRTVQLLLEAWGQPDVTADALMLAALLAEEKGHMATYARLAFELHKRYPAESNYLFEPELDLEDEDPLPRLSALLEAWAFDTRGIREEQAAVRAQLDDLAAVRQGARHLLVGKACMQKYGQ